MMKVKRKVPVTVLCSDCGQTWETNLDLDEAACIFCSSLCLKEYIEKPKSEYE